MSEYEIKYVDVFTTEEFCGNSAGVITRADGIDQAAMQRISGEMNLSESTFVMKPQSSQALFRVKFFTPLTEYDLSGHAMIGTCFAMAEEGRIPLKDGRNRVLVETNVGIIPVDIFFETQGGGNALPEKGDFVKLSGKYPGNLKKIMMHQTIMSYQQASVDLSTIASTLGIAESEISGTGMPMEVISNGLTQLLIPVQNSETIRNMNPDMIRLKLLNSRLHVQTSDIFTLDSIDPQCITYSRHFSPDVGMWEDTGSGSAAVSIATYLVRHGAIQAGSYVMQQGKELEKSSKVLVDIESDDGEVDSAWVGGLAVTSISRKIKIEECGIMIT